MMFASLGSPVRPGSRAPRSAPASPFPPPPPSPRRPLPSTGAGPSISSAAAAPAPYLPAPAPSHAPRPPTSLLALLEGAAFAPLPVLPELDDGFEAAGPSGGLGLGFAPMPMDVEGSPIRRPRRPLPPPMRWEDVLAAAGPAAPGPLALGAAAGMEVAVAEPAVAMEIEAGEAAAAAAAAAADGAAAMDIDELPAAAAAVAAPAAAANPVPAVAAAAADVAAPAAAAAAAAAAEPNLPPADPNMPPLLAATPPPPPPHPLAAPHKRDAVADLEQGVWELPAAAAAAAAAAVSMSEPQPVFLRSLNSQARTRVLFANDSGEHVTAFWLDYNGQEVPYGGLAAGQAKIYDTYVSHPWLFRASASGERMLAAGAMSHFAAPLPAEPPAEARPLGQRPGQALAAALQASRVSITPRPLLQHSADTHSAFPAAFKAAARALLLSYQRLQRPDLAAAAEAAAAARRTVADVMCRLVRNVLTSVITAAQPAMAAMAVCSPAAAPPATTAAAAASCTLSAPASASAATAESCPDACSRSVSRWLAELNDGTASTAAAAATSAAAPRTMRMHVDDSPVADVSAAAAAAAAAPSGRGGRRQLELTSPLRSPARSEAMVAASGLAELPVDLVRYIIHLAAPVVAQHVGLGPRGCPDIRPTRLPSDPATWRPMEAEAAAPA